MSNFDIQKLNEIIKEDNNDYPSCNININYKNNNKAIFICIDINCINGLIMLIQSFLKHNNVDDYVFNIFCEKSVFEVAKKTMKLLFDNTNYNIKLFDNNDLNVINKYIDNSCSVNKHCKNDMNFARFFYEKYFEENYYLYIDADIIINGNVDVFFNNLENNYIMVVQNFELIKAVKPKEDKIKYLESEYKLKFNSNGFNAGIYSINNIKSKNENNLDKIISLMNKEYDTFNFGTQPVLNLFYNDKLNSIQNNYFDIEINNIKKSITEWNETDISINKVNLTSSLINNFKSIHFCGSIKPWHDNSPHHKLFLSIIFDNKYIQNLI
jgi:lipopolysaccharide biosynthesis glycosyltransferase